MSLVAKRGKEIGKSVGANSARQDKLSLASNATVKSVLARYAVPGETIVYASTYFCGKSLKTTHCDLINLKN